MGNTEKSIYRVLIGVLLIGVCLLAYNNIRLTQQIGELEEEVGSQYQEIEALQENVDTLVEEKALLQEKLKGTLPYTKASGSPITLRNNFGNVQNPSWAELKSFLEQDDTSSIAYNEYTFVCGDFAELVHNNAEAVGIRAGVAILYFEDDWPLHAITVFHTTDHGLIYIDSTGTRLFVDGGWEEAPFGLGQVWRQAEGEDKVAYVEIGREYGAVPIDVASCFSYECYIVYMTAWQAYTREVLKYNDEVDEYNLALGSRLFLEEPEYTYFMNWHSRLEAERARLTRLAKELGDYWYEPLGIVTGIEIYWSGEKWDGG